MKIPGYLLLFLLLAACTQDAGKGGARASSPPSPEADSTATSKLSEMQLSPRETLVKQNIEFHLRDQLNGRSIIMGPIEDSDIEGFDHGLFTVGRNTYQFLVSESDQNILFLAADPFEVYKSDYIAGVLKEEAETREKTMAEARVRLASEIESAPVRGNPDAPVTIVEFSDFQCPYCRKAYDTIGQIMQKHADDVRLIYLHYPLSFHPWARPSAIAAVCTAEQDPSAFWKLHDHYFTNQKEFGPNNVMDKSRSFVGDLGLDLNKWSECAENADSQEHKDVLALIDTQLKLGSDLGLTGTPGFFVNGQFINGAQPLQVFEKAIADAKNAEG